MILVIRCLIRILYAGPFATQMEDAGADYGPVLKEAQALGEEAERTLFYSLNHRDSRYAEANSGADAEGLDVQVGGILINLISKPSSVIYPPPGEDRYPG